MRKYTFIFLSYAGVIVLAALGAAYVMEDKQMQSIDARLAAAAKGLKYMLAEDFHDRAVDARSISLEEELRNRKVISDFAAQAGFVYAYTLAEKNGNYYFSAPTVTPEEAKERERWYFYPYDDVPAGFVKAMREGVETFSTYTDQWGTFRSVAIPETSPGGVRYLSCVDMDVSFIKQERAKYLAMAGGAAVLLILSSLPLLLLHRRNNVQYADSLLRMNNELVATNARLQKLDAAKSSLLTRVSHELRTPLTSIVGFMKLVARDFDRHFAPLVNDSAPLQQKKQRIRNNLGTVIGESERLMRLVNDCLDLSKIELGKMEWRDTELSPAEAARIAVDSLRGESEAKPEVALRTEIAPELPGLYADPDKIHQLLINLLSNAIKFTDRGSVTLRVTSRDNFVIFQVRDSGSGIRPEDQDKIFDEFYRSLHDDTVQDHRKGTGLGLPICRQIAEHYGGRINVASEYGKGSTFTVLLRVAGK